jgi:DNA-binding IclR family transcriptional regulator
MKSQANISKSVARTFRVLELFREVRKPMTAAQIQHALEIPQPSARVLLKELVDIGYLAYTMPAKTYFPTPRLCRIGDWLGSSLIVHEPLIRAVDAISREVDETANLCTATYGHVEVLYVRRADHPLSLQVSAGMGGSLWRSAVGRTLLSLRTDRQVEEFLDGLEPRDAPRGRRQREQLVAQIRQIRNLGYLFGYDILMKGVGAICVPLAQSITSAPLVVTVAGGKDRIQPREKAILRSIRTQVREVQGERGKT